jgi:hypothetical protein
VSAAQHEPEAALSLVPLVWACLLGLLAVVGRAWLAWLPPGRPGSHAPRSLAATWGASHVLGAGWLYLVSRADVAGWIPDPAHLPLTLGLPLLLLVLRLVTLPAGFVPRHEPPAQRATLFSRACAVAAALAVIGLPRAFGGAWPDPMAAAGALAGLALLAHGLETARTPAWARGLALVALGSAFGALVVSIDPSGSAAAGWTLATTAAGGAGAVAWIRRADARGLALVALAPLAAGAYEVELALLPGAVSLWASAATPAPARARALTWTLFGLAPLGLIAWLAADGDLGAPSFSARLQRAGLGFLLLFVFGIAAGASADAQRRGAGWNPSGAAPGRERRVLLAAVASAVGLAWLLRQAGPPWQVEPPVYGALTLLALLFGAGLGSITARREGQP